MQPLLLTGDDEITQATDVSPAGAVVGTSAPFPPPVITSPLRPRSGWRWLVSPVAGPALAQRLTVPTGTVGVEVNGVTDLGEAGGVVIGPATYDRQPVRWSAAGTRTTALTPPSTGNDVISQVTAVGPAQWAVYTGGSISGTSVIVGRNGTRTEPGGAPDFHDARIITVTSIAGPRTALLGTTTGVGRGSQGHSVIWQDGATYKLPTFGQLDVPQSPCVSAIQPDGTVAYSGITNYSQDTGFTRVMALRRGVAGADIALPTAGRVGSLGCATLDTLSADGWVAGYLFDASATPAPEVAALWHVTNGAAPTLTTIPVRAGETGVRAVALASRGRAVVVARAADGASTPWLWSNGARTPLALPAGWALRDVVEMTDTGLVLANVRNSEGAVRPVLWRTAG
ncbi:hypothetical protein [Frankia sp. AgKG'84/4]|uniref:hypothetical protein n=1 Tax=Frankia sp. AgKG'84/4 TaxID=573490 RepID=UPI00202A915A|nr:hypothetical protein [Frankia sp. AgKG'84/4]MCL9795418.1 hypothetical protein [Frankia sp. AgKG'84/4]